MTPQQLVDQAKAKFTQAAGHFQDEMKKLRTGRASASMLDGVMVTAYGTPMPLNQVANITAPEAQLLQITPFDPGNLAAISTAIRENPSLGMNPMDDGRVVRVPVPPLNEERRREIVKVLGGKVEDAMVSLRNARHDAIKELDQAKKDRDIGEDDAKRLEKQIDDAMNQAKADIDISAQAKEQEILTV
ncbi:MAG TPA: ribosome recycling factor [Candidatus Saccharimonadales bacterium]|nr:ribosome recycling factor [Candidatus Saccharimonadales bacterium]